MCLSFFMFPYFLLAPIMVIFIIYLYNDDSFATLEKNLSLKYSADGFIMA